MVVDNYPLKIPPL